MPVSLRDQDVYTYLVTKGETPPIPNQKRKLALTHFALAEDQESPEVPCRNVWPPRGGPRAAGRRPPGSRGSLEALARGWAP